MNQSKIDALIEKYQSWQGEAWLDVPESIGDIEVQPMNLKHLLILDGIDSPMIKGGDINEQDMFMFLWVLNKDFCYDSKMRDKFFVKARKQTNHHLKQFIQEILDKSFAESDTMKNSEKQQTFFIAYFVDCFAREYGWTVDEIMNLPLARAFQLITSINERNCQISGKQFNRTTELDNKINRYLLSSQNEFL
jgi:hypothetical protein